MLISFIVPVYNVERYLPTCLDSILNQGIESDDYEIILVEDKSTDCSLQICRDYCARYKNITLIENEKNIGPGLSRNKGIDASKGAYLHFVDSDDLLLSNSLYNLLSLDIISQNPDIIRFESSRNNNYDSTYNRIIYSGKYNGFFSQSPYMSAWHYWFRRQFLIESNISFLDKITGQDAIFTFSALSKNPSVVIASTLVYIYRNNSKSITHNKDMSYVDCLWEVIDEIKNVAGPLHLSTLYITEIYKDIAGRFYRCRRTLHECIIFKNRMKLYRQYNSIIKKGHWYLQLSRIPLLLYIYLLIKK